MLDINVADNPDPEDNYFCEKEIQLTQLRVGVSKKYKQIALGLESSISSQLIGMSLTVSGYLP